MRSRSFSLALLAVGFAPACSDSAPTYPPIIVYVTGSESGSGASSANGATGAVGAAPNGSGAAGGSSGAGSGAAGASTAGGSDANDPLAHCNQLWSEPLPEPETACDLDALTDGGTLRGDIEANRTLKRGHSYLLEGAVRVLAGVTLTVEPCVKVVGKNSDAVLAVLSGVPGNPEDQCHFEGAAKPVPGGKLVAVGEAMAPVVFTSAKPKGERRSGDWGGILLLGNARHNAANDHATNLIEGLAKGECFGWYDSAYDEESSGKLEYVRIEYASRQVAADSETNGLTLGALGSGTELHYVMVSNSADDCFEWFGGKANADHLVALNCEDDAFDADNGFAGHLQFLFARQASNASELQSRGFEIDGQKNQFFLPRTATQISNFTICGGGNADSSQDRTGIVLRRNPVDVVMSNGIITGFTQAGIYADAQPNLSYLQFFGNTVVSTAGRVDALATVTDKDPGNPVPGLEAQTILKSEGVTAATPDRFCNCWSNPPVPVAARTREGKVPPGFANTDANYVGAFKGYEAQDNWMRGAWVDWSSE